MEKTTKNGIHRITQADGKTIAWAEESGVKVLEKDGNNNCRPGADGFRAGYE